MSSFPSISLNAAAAAAVVLIILISLVVVDSHDEENTKQQWKWYPEKSHPCTVDRMTPSQVLETFGPEGIPPLYRSPLVILANDDDNDDENGNEKDKKTRNNEVTRQRVQEDMIRDSFSPGFHVTLSSSNSFSQHRRTIPLDSYLREMKDNNGVTSPNQLSNESWYLFGETYGEEWKYLLRDYDLPPCRTCQPKYIALSFGIGNRGSGVQWHIHGPGFSESLVGRKHWIMYPPYYQPPFFHHDQSTRNWMENIYTNTTKLKQYAQDQLQKQQEEKSVDDDDDDINIRFSSIILKNNGRPLECTLEPGDMIYFPDRWHHATINCDPYTAFVSTFTSDFLYLHDQEIQERETNPESLFMNDEL